MADSATNKAKQPRSHIGVTEKLNPPSWPTLYSYTGRTSVGSNNTMGDVVC